VLLQRLKFHTLPTVQKLDFLMANFQDVQAEVAAQKLVVAQTIAVINGIPAQVAAAVAAATDGAVDQTAFDQLAADIKASTDALTAALNPPQASA
jgi:hypothetical protein